MKLLSFDNLDKHVPLYVKNDKGQYELATPAQILAGSRQVVDLFFTPGTLCNNPSKVKAFLSGKLAGLEHEVFGVIFLDNQLRLIEYKEMFHGSINQASVYPREIARTALHLNASAVVISHNHPSGTAEPSNADIELTKHLVKVLKLLEIRLIDHILVAGAKTVSFAEKQLM